MFRLGSGRVQKVRAGNMPNGCPIPRLGADWFPLVGARMIATA